MGPQIIPLIPLRPIRLPWRRVRDCDRLIASETAAHRQYTTLQIEQGGLLRRGEDLQGRWAALSEMTDELVGFGDRVGPWT